MEPARGRYRAPRATSRLRQNSLDPLESIGLPSRGDSRLLNFKTQEEYFGKVVERYERCLPLDGDNDTIDAAFSSLSLDEFPEDGTEANLEKQIFACAPSVSKEKPSELSIILMAMRKFREAIVASGRKDVFAIRAYAFMIRAAILMRHVESYHPALLHLLRNLHTVTSLTASEHHEFVGFYILDLSCRQNDLPAAYKVGCYHHYKNVKVGRMLKALVHGDWHAFWKIKRLVSVHQQRLLEHGEQRMRQRALDCIGQSYLSVDKRFLEMSVQRRWEQLKDEFDVDWKLETDVVTIRQIKRK